MVDSSEPHPKDDQVVLCVRYTTSVGQMIGLGLVGIALLFVAGIRDAINQGGYILALGYSGGALVVMMLATDVFLTQHILFCEDRIVKVWYLFGYRTISYARAKLFVKPRSLDWLGGPSKAFDIKETDNAGKVPWLQVPISYCSLCVSPEMRRKVEAAASYLVGVEDSSKLYEDSRGLVHAILPKELPWA